MFIWTPPPDVDPLTNAMIPKLVLPLKTVVPEECVAGGTRVVAGSGLKG
jgi:hypothetical protein